MTSWLIVSVLTAYMVRHAQVAGPTGRTVWLGSVVLLAVGLVAGLAGSPDAGVTAYVFAAFLTVLAGQVRPTRRVRVRSHR